MTLMEQLGADRLSRGQQIALMRELFEALATTEAPRSLLTSAKIAELERRFADAQTNPHDWVPAADMITAALQRYSE
jgi:putative addiction module component (TIGR02574 family)